MSFTKIIKRSQNLHNQKDFKGIVVTLKLLKLEKMFLRELVVKISTLVINKLSLPLKKKSQCRTAKQEGIFQYLKKRLML
jgi:hypothetical protein